MLNFFVEQHLPCTQDEIYGYKRKVPFNSFSYEDSIRLKYDANVIPFNTGYKVYISSYTFFVSDIILLQKLTGTLKLRDILLSNDCLEDLEIINAHALLTSDKGTIKINTYDVPIDIKNKYSSADFGWFSFVPSKIELDILPQCNFACIHCSRDASIKKQVDGQLSFEDIKSIINDASSIGVKALTLMGGEPLLHPKFFEICRFAKSHGIRNLSTSTNGWLITKEVAKKLREYFTNIQVSLHGASSATQDKIVNKKGAFDKTIQSIQYLTAEGCNVNISFTVMKENVHDIEAIFNLAEKLNAKAIRYLVLGPQGRGRNLTQWMEKDKSTISALLKDLHSRNGQSKVEITCGGFSPIKKLNDSATFCGCPAGRELIYISSDGSVSVCGVIEDYLGNIKNNSIMELWHSPKMIELRKTLKCSCAYTSICAGPCLANKRFNKRGGLI